jgi:hypothetical protein
VPGVLDALRKFQLLTSAQLNELILDNLKGRFADPRALAKELLGRGWLTPYQGNLLLQGRGQD